MKVGKIIGIAPNVNRTNKTNKQDLTSFGSDNKSNDLSFDGHYRTLRTKMYVKEHYKWKTVPCGTQGETMEVADTTEYEHLYSTAQMLDGNDKTVFKNKEYGKPEELAIINSDDFIKGSRIEYNPYHDLECVGDREYNEKVYFTDKNEEVDIPNLSGKPAYVVFAPGAHKPAPPKKTFFQRLFW